MHFPLPDSPVGPSVQTLAVQLNIVQTHRMLFLIIAEIPKFPKTKLILGECEQIPFNKVVQASKIICGGMFLTPSLFLFGCNLKVLTLHLSIFMFWCFILMLCQTENMELLLNSFMYKTYEFIKSNELILYQTKSILYDLIKGFTWTSYTKLLPKH